MEIKTICDYPFTRCRITCEGNIAFCCYQESFIGNILTNTFDEIWFGDTAEEIRLDISNGKFHKFCQVSSCPYQTEKSKHKVNYAEYPTFLEIDFPNTHCNVGFEEPSEKNPACVMCPRSSITFKSQNNHLFEVINRLKHLTPFLRQVHFGGVAEPFYKDLIFEIANLLNINQKVTISTITNGTLLNQEITKKFLKFNNSILTFSLDAATSQTYHKIRILSSFDEVLGNLYSYGEKRNKKNQFLKIINNINMLNIHEVKEMCKIAKKAGVNLLEFIPTEGWNKEILVNESNCGLFKRAQMEIEQECYDLGVPFIIIKPLDCDIMDNLIQISC